VTDKTTAGADHYAAEDFAREMETLKTEAAASGGASKLLQRYTNHFTMLAYRTADGPAEVHARHTDMFFAVRGKATLVTGGTVEGAYEESPGETRGRNLEGGQRTALGAGDVINIPAGTPHQMLIAPGEVFVYFVVKVKERD